MNILFRLPIKPYILGIIAIGFTYCRSSDNVSGNLNHSTTDKNLLVFDLKKLPDLGTLKISELGAKEVAYIPLETFSDKMISQINSMVFSSNYLITINLSNLFLFGNDGKFIAEIGKKGEGPEEYSGVSDLDINDVNGSIYLYDGRKKKFFVFNNRGKYVRAFEGPVHERSMLKLRLINNTILCYNVNNQGNIKNSFFLIDTIGSVIMSLPNKYNYSLVFPGVFYDGENLFYKFGKKLFCKEIYCDTIFCFNDKGFIPHMVINVGDLRLTPEARSSIRSISDAEEVLNNHINPWNLFEFGGYIYYEIVVKVNGRRDLYAFIGSKKGDFRRLIIPYEGLINDLDGGPNFWPKTVKDDSTLVSWIDAVKFKEYVASDAFKNSQPLSPEKKKDIENLANNLKETDNPVLMLVKVKN